MKRALFLLAITSGCSGDGIEPDAYGNFEATEITISAEQPGKILFLDAEEGTVVEKGQVLGLIDTTKLHLQKRQLQVKGQVLKARFPNISRELDVLLEQKTNLTKEANRFGTLAEKGVVPKKQVDDLNDQIAVINKRIEVVKSQNKPLSEELELNRLQIELVNEQIRDAMILSPVSGTVLLKQVEAGEMVTTGMPLFRVADLSQLVLRAYVSGSQLDDFRLGQEVTVLTDRDRECYHRHRGMITWVADEAEFTPKIIQTKNERTDLVYAVKVKVPNDGILKIGMPGEVLFSSPQTQDHD